MQQQDVICAFGNNLRECRTKAGITQTELAGRLGYSSKSVSKWEHGDGIPSAAVLPMIAEALGTDVGTLLRTDSEPSYFLGIDGGGTKTEFLLCGRDGKKISGCVLDGCNPNDVGVEKCREVLEKGCKEVCAGIPRKYVSVFAGIAGAGVGKIGELTEYLRSLGFMYAKCESDTRLAVVSVLGDADGVVVIMGTGIAVIVQKQGKSSILGAFNYFFDKGGSGFNIGRDAILYALLCEERGLKKTPLYEAVLKKCASDTVRGDLGRFYSEGKRYIAGFSPAVFDTAGRDAASRRIIRDNAACAGEIISYALSLLDGVDAVHFTGGLSAHADLLEGPLRESISRPCKLLFHKGSSIEGALTLAGLRIKPC